MSQTYKTSEANREIVSKLKGKFEAEHENIVAQFAIAYSISQGRHFKVEDAKDSGGKEYRDHLLGGNRYYIFTSLIRQHYNLNKSSTEIPKLLKIHLDDGLELMAKFLEENPSFTGFEFLLYLIENGLLGLSTETTLNFNSMGDISGNSYNKPYCSTPIKIQVGKEIETEDEVFLTLNDITKYNNCHLAVAGSSGTGKTHFAFNLLRKIVNESNQVVKFIYLDYKGLEGSLSEDQEDFFEHTNCELIQSPYDPFPVNPLSIIDLVNDKNQKIGIRNFVDSLKEYGNLGSVQYHTLLTAVTECFKAKKNTTPTLKEIFEHLNPDRKPDTLTGIMGQLAEQDIFSNNLDGANLLDRNIYLSLSPVLPESIRKISVFLIVNYIFLSFMKMPDTPDENGIKGIRYILLIDEAHRIFNENKSRTLLENILRMIRSKGVSVMLFSQGISEFTQPGFDFSSNCEISFLMKLKDQVNINAALKFLGFSENDKSKISGSLSNLQKYQALTNLKELKPGKLIQL